LAALARAFTGEASSPLVKAVRDFLGHLAHRGASVNTIAAYRSDLEQLAYFLETHRPGGGYSALDRAAVEEFVVGLKESGYRDASVARKLAAARSFFVFLANEGVLSGDPTEGFAGPRVARVLPRPIGAREIATLLEQPARRSTPEARRDRAMLELLYATGMRVSELVALDIDNVHLENKRPFVRCPGSRGAARDVPITRRCYEALAEYLESARPLIARSSEERALFVNTRGGRITRQGFWFILKGYARAVGEGVRITPHTLRHSFAAHKLGGGVPLSNVQQMLGHSAPSSTRIYSRLTGGED
jgi:integrase/recombinase XerD